MIRPQLSFLPDLHVVAVSGGKDSTALALRLAEIEPRDYTYIITPTGNEPDAMFAHWRKLAEMLGSPLTVVVNSTLVTEIQRQGGLPSWHSRWCTRMLKIEPCAQWLAAHSPATLYVGIRADEPLREGGDYAAVPGIEIDFPFRRWGWSLRNVVDYNAQRGVMIPARPFEIQWLRDAIAWGRDAGVAVWAKQLGAVPGTLVRTGDGCDGLGTFRFDDVKIGGRKGDDMDEWPADLRVRQMPGARV